LNSIYKDKILFLCIGGILLSSGTLLYRKLFIITQSGSEQALQIKQDEKHKQMEEEITNLKRQISSMNEKNEARQVQPPALEPKKPLRPRKEDNVWVIGKGPLADTDNLELALNNSLDGDFVILEEGIYEFGLHFIKAKYLVIEGRPNAKLIYRHTPRLSHFNELTIRNVEISFFDQQLDFISLAGNNSRLHLQDVKMTHPKLTFSFRDQFEVILENVQTAGIALRFSGNSKVKIINSFLEKASTLITLADQAEADITKTHLFNFSNVGITSDSADIRLRASNINVNSGLYAFWGKFNALNSQVKDSKFHNLKEFTLSGTTVNCSLCEKYDIQR
jgi:hypothetical protein